MLHQHDHTACKKNALERAKRVCTENGARLTPVREKVLKLIWNSHKPIKAYDLLAALSDGDRIEKPPTVYRALQFLSDLGLVHKIQSMNAYVGCSVNHGRQDSQFFVCDQCQEVEELNEPKVNQQLSEVCERQGFVTGVVNVEIHGICAKCANAER